MRLKKLSLLVALILAVAGFFVFDLGQYFNLQTLKAQQSAIEAFRAGQPVLAVAVYFSLYVLVTALSLPGAALLTLAGGAVFGLLWGTVIVSFASTVGATLAFLISRFLLRDWVAARFGQRLQAIDEGVRREGAFYLFTLRLVPVFPFFVINLLFGLTAMKVSAFYWASQIGMLAGTGQRNMGKRSTWLATPYQRLSWATACKSAPSGSGAARPGGRGAAAGRLAGRRRGRGPRRRW